MMQELVERVKDVAKDAVNDAHTVIPGKIVSFDPATCQAVVQPVMTYRKPDKTTIDYPQITGVPVYFPQGNNQQASISWVVKPGDGCLLLCAEQALDYWMYGSESDSDLRFDLTNTIAIVGLFVHPGPGVQRACDEDAVVVMAGDVVLTVKPELVQIDGNLQVNGWIHSTEDMVAGSISQQHHTHTAPHGETSPPH